MSALNHSATDSASAVDSKAPRRKALQSGFSLLARGEPQIWFTGGMLAICLAMIASLLTLILAAGLPTFWPRPIDWLVLRSGAFEIGERQMSVAASRSNETGTDAKENSASDGSSGPSYYYRTENFDISNEHYRWFGPTELQADGISRVPDVTLIERIEWGPLYGLPLHIAERLANDEDREIAAVLNDLQAILPMVAQFNPGTENDRAEHFQRALEVVRQKGAADSNKSLRAQLAKPSGGLLQVRLSGEQNWRALSDIPADAIIQQARSVFVDRQLQLNRLSRLLPQIAVDRRQLDRQKRQLSRLDAMISRARVAVRQAELDSDSVLPVLLDDSHYLIEQLVQQDRQSAQIVEAKRVLQATLDADSTTINKATVLRGLDEYADRAISEQRKATEEQLSTWRKGIEKSPQNLRDAVSSYVQTYRQVLVAQFPLQREINRLQAKLAYGELVLAVPNGAKRLDGLNSDDVTRAARGDLSTAVAAGLDGMGMQVGTGSTQVFHSSGAATIVAFEDSLKLRHLLSIAQSNYLADRAEVLSVLHEHSVPLEQLVRVMAVNQLSLSGKFAVYCSRWWEFLSEDPREANTLGGVFPAICGTIAMTLFMTIAVVPFGVLAALYLREYTSSGPIVSVIRISINNLAGVPSIVYGVFGFSFFCMTIGSFIDGGPAGAGIVPWPSGTWFAALGLAAIVGTAAFFFSFLGSGPAHRRTRATRWISAAALFLWLACLACIVALIAKSPFFDGFYAAQLPNPTFGKGGLLWAALTLSLLTLPVVIVATEEALAAVPNSLREGSLACGASKWQTIRRIVLPHARPGILTGAILAMARGAGEVAPLMLVGALPNAPELPVDGEFPFFHGSRNFMHLGYQIYSLGFQSQNSEAARPMVFTCTLLLIAIVATLNISAIYLRSRLRRRFQSNQF